MSEEPKDKIPDLPGSDAITQSAGSNLALFVRVTAGSGTARHVDFLRLLPRGG